MSTHFGGKSVPEHLVDARKKGALVSTEYHGRELSGAFAAAVDSCKETSILLLLLIILMAPSWQVIGMLMAGYLVWKVGRSACLGWARLERLHRLIEEERYEIEHHREDERAELKEIYAAKGFKDKQLEEVLDVLMADDNRLLMVMLEEELGLPLDSYEHPLRQALGAAIGVIIGAGCVTAAYMYGFFAALAATSVLILGISFIAAKRENNAPLKACIWNLAIATVAIGATYFIKQL